MHGQLEVKAWLYRRIDAEEGPSIWSCTTDPKQVEILSRRDDYEIEPLVMLSEISLINK